MKFNEYRHLVDKYIFDRWIDIPLEYEYMVDIISTQFFNNNIEVKYACNFADLIIDVHTKGEFDFVFEYEPFNVLDNELSDDFVYVYDRKVNFESFEIIIDGEIRIDVNYKENLSYEALLAKIKKLDEPLD